MDELRGLLLHHGPSHEVASCIQREQRRLDLGIILEETFRRIDLGPRDLVCRQGAYVSPEVEFLLRHGGFLHPERLNTLLEDTYRYIELGPLEFKRRAGACLSPEVEFLLIQGADFGRLPGLPQIAEDTKAYLRQSGQNQRNFFLQQAIQNNIHKGWRPLLDRVYISHLESVDSEILCHIVRHISSQQGEIKIYTKQFREDGILWPLVTLRRKDNLLINASIVELRGRSGELDEVTMRVQEREIKVSRPLLEARSSYFKKLIDNTKTTSFNISGLYSTIEFVVFYAHSELDDVDWEFDFKPCDSRDTTETTLNELINILHAANTFEMADLFAATEQHIVIHGKGFIYAKNAQEIKEIAKEVNAMFLERYCDAFIQFNISRRTFRPFPDLPIELRANIWRQAASQPRLFMASRIRELTLEIPSHINILSRACKESYFEMQRVWGKPRMGGVNFEFDIVQSGPIYFPRAKQFEEASYCFFPTTLSSVSSGWEFTASKIIKCCPRLKVLYLGTKILSHNDEIEYCRQFTNREPTTIVEARNWIEESAHQRLRENIPEGCGLPKIILIDETEIKRLSVDI
ncbi:hypothetical protein V501_00488 [Pseudogymnoascus sp. VKM F-4519 (FW-2642)]|nr:hypothetical protein V501_00488 [Pseudogymnoascus sp. VKM F-4519 (FW-2642)]